MMTLSDDGSGMKCDSEVLLMRRGASPFDDDCPWIASQLEADPALQATTLGGLLNERRPGGYQYRQVRTLLRQIASWLLSTGRAVPLAS